MLRYCGVCVNINIVVIVCDHVWWLLCVIMDDCKCVVLVCAYCVCMSDDTQSCDIVYVCNAHMGYSVVGVCVCC